MMHHESWGFINNLDSPRNWQDHHLSRLLGFPSFLRFLFESYVYHVYWKHTHIYIIIYTHIYIYTYIYIHIYIYIPPFKGGVEGCKNWNIPKRGKIFQMKMENLSAVGYASTGICGCGQVSAKRLKQAFSFFSLPKFSLWNFWGGRCKTMVFPWSGGIFLRNFWPNPAQIFQG